MGDNNVFSFEIMSASKSGHKIDRILILWFYHL